ncbi:MAG: aminotransferase class V-fold PLP-dependent enzyme, partial [bacterium]|nr:aminotransferase class V-fold PLP-dependent enzyme [bacterium]
MNLLFGNIAARKASIPNAETYGAFHELEQGVSAALETFSNVHRGTGHFSMVTTELFEQGRDVFLEYLGLDKKDYVVVFCTVRGADIFERRLKSHDYHIVSSRDIGLPLGLRVLAIRKNILPKGLPFQTGGGAIKDVAPDSVLWADAPDKFEAGTPRIVNVIAFTRALMITRKLGTDCFKQQNRTIYSADEILYNDELLEYSGLPLLTELRKRVFGRNQLVPTAEGEKPYINFDNGACTPTFSPIREAVCKSWQQPENVQADIVTAVKKTLADFLGASPDKYDILF